MLQGDLLGPNDGHTFVMGQMGSMAVAPITNKQPIDVRAEFVPVAMAYTNYLLLAAHPSVPAKTIPELVAYSKANPGKLRLETTVKAAFRTCLWNCFRSGPGWTSYTCLTRATIRYWPT